MAKTLVKESFSRDRNRRDQYLAIKADEAEETTTGENEDEETAAPRCQVRGMGHFDSSSFRSFQNLVFSKREEEGEYLPGEEDSPPCHVAREDL